MADTEKAKDSEHQIPAKTTGIRHFFDALSYSCAGISACFRSEFAFRGELLSGIVLNIALIFLPLSLLMKAALVFTWLMLLCVELLNSGLEALVDLVSPGWNSFAKKAKDCGSAAVLCMLISWIGSWLFAFWKLANIWFLGK